MQIESISDITRNASLLTEDDLIHLTLSVVDFYETKIAKLAVRAYGASTSTVSKDAFKELAKVTIAKAMQTFMFTKQHWKTNRDLNSYLLVCLRRLADRLFWEQASTKKQSSLICPGCRELPGNPKIQLISEDKKWRCPNCTSEHDRLLEDLKKGKILESLKADTQARITIHKNFAVQSRKGYRCPDIECGRFIPESINGKYGIACPYPDCSFFGSVSKLEEMSHPVTLTVRQTVSLNFTINGADKGGKATEFQDFFAIDELLPDQQISLVQSFEKEYETLLEVIDSQVQTVQRMNNNGTKQQKLLMYKAFKNMCVQHPDEMLSYLVHLKQSAEIPLQPRIFQEYIRLVENALPFNIEKRGEEIEIVSISDPELSLFTGKSEFIAEVDSNQIIPNNTIETYTGNRMYINHGSCFIGRIVDVQLLTGESVLDKIESYSFVQIFSTLEPGTKVKVIHYRIPSHYEMGSLVFLQRIRRLLVDRIYFKLNGKKRVVTRKAS